MPSKFNVGDEICVESHSDNGTIFLALMGVEPDTKYIVKDTVTVGDELHGVIIEVNGESVPVSDDDVVLVH